MTHASVPEKERSVLGISDTLIRLSVGLEDEADIIEDLDQALAAAVSNVQRWTGNPVWFVINQNVLCGRLELFCSSKMKKVRLT